MLIQLAPLTTRVFQSRRRANADRKRARVVGLSVGLFFILLALLSLSLGFWFISYPAFVIAFLMILASLFSSGGNPTWAIGAQGEEKVAEYLASLNDSYYVIHDVVLPGMTGNIDHVVLGPNGVFVIETKNHNGLITCNGDFWTQRKIGRLGTPYLGNIGSPSRQVKREAMLLQRFIQYRFKTNLYVTGIVVFTNEEADLQINSPTVAILKPQDVGSFIQNHSSRIPESITLKELEETLRIYSCFD